MVKVNYDCSNQIGEPQLRPCPFFGGDAHILGGPDAQETYSVWCIHVDCGFSREGAAERWNKRMLPK